MNLPKNYLKKILYKDNKMNKYRVFANIIIVFIFMIFTFNFFVNFSTSFDVDLFNNFEIVLVNLFISLLISFLLILFNYIIGKFILLNKIVKFFVYILIVLSIIFWSQHLINYLSIVFSLEIREVIKSGFYLKQIFYSIIAAIIIITLLTSTSISLKRKKNEISKKSK